MDIHLYGAILIFSYLNHYVNKKKQCADEKKVFGGTEREREESFKYS